jgi:hypothetical protein
MFTDASGRMAIRSQVTGITCDHKALSSGVGTIQAASDRLKF